MDPIENVYLLVIDELSAERRQIIHELVKSKTSLWWHNMPNVWIVTGQSSIYWRSELFPVIAGTGGSILVLRLPEKGDGRTWAFQGPNSREKSEWLYKSFTGMEPPDS